MRPAHSPGECQSLLCEVLPMLVKQRTLGTTNRLPAVAGRGGWLVSGGVVAELARKYGAAVGEPGLLVRGFVGELRTVPVWAICSGFHLGCVSCQLARNAESCPSLGPQSSPNPDPHSSLFCLRQPGR